MHKQDRQQRVSPYDQKPKDIPPLPPSDPIGVGSTMYVEQLRIEEQRAINKAILNGEGNLHDQYIPIEDMEARLRQSSMGMGLDGWEDGFDRVL